MSTFIKRYSANTLVVSVMLLILSVFLIFKPAESLTFIMILLGCIALLDGIIHIVSYLCTSKEFRAFSFELVQGILAIILGIIFMFNPQVVVSFLPFIIGVWIFLEGIIKLQFAFNVKATETSNWIALLLLAILTAILGLIIIFNPFGTVITITLLAGIVLFITEILNIAESIYVIIKFK